MPNRPPRPQKSPVDSGTVQFEILLPNDDGAVVLSYEVYRDAAAFETLDHMKTALSTQFGQQVQTSLGMLRYAPAEDQHYYLGLLYEIQPTDLTTLIVVSLVLMTSILIAGFLPARRASRISPLLALREE